MQKGTYRIHGCARCKKRKIQCDNKRPSCSQCSRVKKPCPGSTTGFIFQHAGTWIPVSDPLVRYNQRQEDISRLAVEIGHLNISPWTPHHWFFTLPQLQLSMESQKTILTPLLAISAAFKCLHSRDSTLRSLAIKYYAKALAQQRRQLKLLDTDRAGFPGEIVLLPLLTALLLMEFEIMAPLSQYSWAGHAHGSVQLLALLNPEACQVSPLFEIFWQVRFAMGYASLLTGETSFLSHTPWREVPFLRRAKTSLDELTDVSSTDRLLDVAEATSIPDAQVMMRLLRNALRLCSPVRPDLSPDQKREASRFILLDSERLLAQDSISFRMALQCIFSMRLVLLYAPCHLLRTEALASYNYWHSRYTL